MWQERKYIEHLKKEEKNFIEYKHQAHINGILVFPNSYYIGMSYLGYLQLYKFLNEEGIINCDRFFLENWNDPISFDSYRYLSDFEVILFSVPFQSDFENIVKILRKNHIELDKNKRRRKPLIIAGGPGIWLNPYPLKSIIDIFVLGEGEKKLQFIFNNFNKILSFNENLIPEYRGILFELPKKREALLKEITFEYDCTHIPHSKITTPNTFFSNLALIEIARGCINNCKFCTVSRLYHKKCFRNIDKIKLIMKALKNLTNKIGLISSMVLEHPDIEEILSFAYKEQIEISTSSLSVRGINENIVRLLKLTGNKSVTIALESLSEKSRKEINKFFSNEYFIEKLKLIASNGIKKIKIYLILGLDFEEDDLNKQKKLWENIIKVKNNMNINIHFSINPLIPQPFTPYFNKTMLSKQEIKKKYKWFKSNFKGLNIKFEGINNAIKEYNYAFSQKDLLYIN